MSGNDYVKFVTQELVRYMNLTKEEKVKRKSQKGRYTRQHTLFGILPMAAKMLFRKNK
ncbi:YqzE family protein [Thalassobacillus pellis]|uniref:YqzE family protein n=1 Tax=Thalassobacillus pellis TaxID=748008 RepID=UPI0019612A07|nr:YqzE family protein [Thalassobacillus pellis]MBM7552308.1 hypothetical protein [Thalassobacillus pellis]